ncbi:MAG: S8 family serine peptidase, partial [Acidimicrobiales bacterium]
GASTNTDGAAYFSNFGPASVDLFSPGLQIRSTLPNSGYGWMSGTSMAAPTVAATAALVWSAHPDYSYAEVKQAIMIGAATRPAFSGKSVVPGRTDALAAVGEGNQDLRFTFGGFDALEPAQPQNVSVGVEIGVNSDFAVSGVSLRATIIRQQDGELYGVADHTVLVGQDGVEETTNEYAEITLSQELAVDATTTSVNLDLQLPEGRYGLLLETVKGAKAAGAAGLVSFVVGDPAPEVTTTTAAPSDNASTTTTQASQTGGGSPTATTTPSNGGGAASATTQPGTPTTQPQSGSGGSGGATNPPVTNTTQAGAGSESGSGTGSGSPTATTSPAGLSIQSVTPNWGNTYGGDVVNIIGSGFAPGAQVLFGDRPATLVYQQDDTYLLVDSPGHTAGLVSVSVVNPDGSKTVREGAYTYLLDGQTPGTTTTQPASAGGGASTPTTQAPAPSGTTTTQAPSQPGTATTSPRSATTQPPSTWPPFTIDSPDGLTLVPLHPDRKASKVTAGILSNAACSTSDCEGVSL